MKPILILDLEGTLLTHRSGKIYPRPGLRDFLEFAWANFERVGFYTLLSEQVAVSSFRALHHQGLVPDEVLEFFYYVKGNRSNKDLGYVEAQAGQAVWLVDDTPGMIVPGQEKQWIPIKSFDPKPKHSLFGPLDPDPIDKELERVKGILTKRLALDR